MYAYIMFEDSITIGSRLDDCQCINGDSKYNIEYFAVYFPPRMHAFGSQLPTDAKSDRAEHDLLHY